MFLFGFNSQPPEGGWIPDDAKTAIEGAFQLTAARRRLDSDQATPLAEVTVSTHSRPKAAGIFGVLIFSIKRVSTHSRPKAAGFQGFGIQFFTLVSTHSRPKAAGSIKMLTAITFLFQLTAARRRLVPPLKPLTGKACIALFR